MKSRNIIVPIWRISISLCSGHFPPGSATQHWTTSFPKLCSRLSPKFLSLVFSKTFYIQLSKPSFSVSDRSTCKMCICWFLIWWSEQFMNNSKFLGTICNLVGCVEERRRKNNRWRTSRRHFRNFILMYVCKFYLACDTHLSHTYCCHRRMSDGSRTTVVGSVGQRNVYAYFCFLFYA